MFNKDVKVPLHEAELVGTSSSNSNLLLYNRYDRVSSFYWTRGSKLCFLIRFSYFSCYFLSLVFLQNCYSLISLHLSWLCRNPISCPVSQTPLALQGSTLYMRPHVSGTECMGFSKQEAHGNLVTLTTSDLSPFGFSECSWCKHLLGERESYLSYSQKSLSSTFLHDIRPSKLRRVARVRNPLGISKLVNKVNCWVPCALLTILRAFLATKSFAAGSSMYP